MTPDDTKPAELTPVVSNSGMLASPNKGGPPAGSANALKNGIFAVGKMPKGSSYVVRLLGRLKRAIEMELEAQGRMPLSVYDDGLLNEVLRHEKRALLKSRWLREADNYMATSQSKRYPSGTVAVHQQQGLTIEGRAALLRDISNATAARNRCMKELGLDTRRSDKPWAAGDFDRIITVAVQASAPDAPRGPLANDDGQGRPESRSGD